MQLDDSGTPLAVGYTHALVGPGLVKLWYGPHVAVLVGVGVDGGGSGEDVVEITRIDDGTVAAVGVDIWEVLVGLELDVGLGQV